MKGVFGMNSQLISLLSEHDLVKLYNCLKQEGPRDPSIIVANAIAQSLRAAQPIQDEQFQKLVIYVIRTSTLEPLQPFLEYQLFRSGFLPEIHFSGYTDWRTICSTPESAIYAEKPDLILLFFQLEELNPMLAESFLHLKRDSAKEEVSQVLAEIQFTLAAIRKFSRAKVLVNNFSLCHSPMLGIYDSQSEISQNGMIEELNRSVRQMCSDHSDVHVFDYSLWSSKVGLGRIRDHYLWLTSRLPLSGSVLNSLAVEYTRYIKALFNFPRKCIVVDLDNTLWGGVLGEDGFDGIKIGQDYPGNAYIEVQRALLSLHYRGILLAICSKNNEPEVYQVFEKHPDMILRLEHFACMQINWNDKASNLERIASDLNIGIDSLAFLDDNPAERSLIRRLLPEVLVLDLPSEPSEYAQVVRDVAEFERFSLSKEDFTRTTMYRAELDRQNLQRSVQSLEEYYYSLNMRLEIGEADQFTIPRISQLTQKTNQFNLTTRRYSESEIQCMVAESDWRVYWLRLEDRFGDSGITGVAILHFIDEENCEIDSLLLSCRVLGRTVESAFLAYLVNAIRGCGRTKLQGWFMPTDRNLPAKDFYACHGFTILKQSTNATLWGLNAEHDNMVIPTWFTVKTRNGEYAEV